MQNYQLKKETNRYIATVQLQFPDATYNLEAAGKKIESKFIASDDKTGVQPYIYLKKYDSSLTSDDEKLEYANKYFNDVVKRKDATNAKIKLANVQEKNNKLAAKANSAVVTDAFDKYEHEADRRLARAQAEAELNNGLSADAELVNKYTNSLNESVEDEFEKMKAELGM